MAKFLSFQREKMHYLPDLSFEYKAAIREVILKGDRIAISFSITECPHPENLNIFCQQLDELLKARKKTERAFWFQSVSAVTADIKGKTAIIFYAEDVNQPPVAENIDFEGDDFDDDDFLDIEGSPPLPFDYSADLNSIVLPR
jgi:hypothetical protein